MNYFGTSRKLRKEPQNNFFANKKLQNTEILFKFIIKDIHVVY